MTTSMLENDLSKPVWERTPGQLGFYLDMFDAKATVSSDVGSRLLFLSTLTERLYDAVSAHSSNQLRTIFYNRNIVNQCTVETVKKGVVIVIRPYDKAAIDALWKSLADGTLQQAVDAIWSNDTAFLTQYKLDRMNVRVRLYDDEKNLCTNELQQDKVKEEWKRTSSQTVAPIVKEIRNFQSNQLSDIIMKLKDDESTFNQPHYLGEFVSVLMDTTHRNKPGSTGGVSPPAAAKLNAGVRGGAASGASGGGAQSAPQSFSLSEYHPLSQQSLLNKDSRNHALQYFNTIIQSYPSILLDIRQKIIIPLHQIHPWYDEANGGDQQRERRRCILQLYENLMQFENDKMNVNTPAFAHRPYAQRLLAREREHFLGLVSVVAVFIQMTEELEEKVDEYLIEAE